MKAHVLIIGLISIAAPLFGQTEKDCTQILDKEIPISDIQENIDGFTNDIQTLIYCEFDSIDYQIFMGPQGNMPLILHSVIFLSNNQSDNTIYSFRELRDFLLDYKQGEEYFQIRKIIKARNEIIEREATLQNWDIDKQLLLQMGLKEKHVYDIHALIGQNEHKQYSEIFTIYSDTLKAQKERQILEKEKEDTELKYNSGIEECVEGLYAYIDYELGLSKSKELNKPTLLYFNGYGSVNARRIENNILLEADIQKYLSDSLVFINLFVDERNKLEESEIYFSETLNKEVIYTGQINLELEMKQYNSDRQPLFVLLDINGKEISRIGYTNDIEEFKAFLKIYDGR